MKTLPVLVFFAFYVSCVYGTFMNMPPKVEEHFTNCKTQLGVSDHELEQMLSAKNDDDLGCLYACVLKGVEVMNNDGKLDVSKVESLAKEMKDPDMTEEFAARLALHCEEDAKAEADECKVAATFMKCASDKNHVI